VAAWVRSILGGNDTSSEPDLEAVDPDQAPPHPLGPRDVIEALAAYSKLILVGLVVVAVAVGAYFLGRSRAPEILQTPTAHTGVLWACNGELVGAVALAPGPVKITTDKGAVLFATVDAHGRLAVDSAPPHRGGRVRVSRGETVLLVPVLPCAGPDG
jgi:hypothetical protein